MTVQHSTISLANFNPTGLEHHLLLVPVGKHIYNFPKQEQFAPFRPHYQQYLTQGSDEVKFYIVDSKIIRLCFIPCIYESRVKDMNRNSLYIADIAELSEALNPIDKLMNGVPIHFFAELWNSYIPVEYIEDYVLNTWTPKNIKLIVLHLFKQNEGNENE